jgi:hypothetical protein
VCYTPIAGRKPTTLGQEVNSHPLKPDKEKRVLRGGGYLPLLLAVDSRASGGQGGNVVLLIRLVFVTCHCGQLLPAVVIHVMLLNLLTQCDRSGRSAAIATALRVAATRPPILVSSPQVTCAANLCYRAYVLLAGIVTFFHFCFVSLMRKRCCCGTC